MNESSGTVLMPRCGACANGKHVKCEHPRVSAHPMDSECCCVVVPQTGRSVEP